MNDWLKSRLLSYLETEQKVYRDSGQKIQCQCISPEHPEERPSAYFDLRAEGEEFFSCSSCGYYVGTESLYRLIDGEIDEDYLFKIKMKNLLKRDTKETKEKTPIIFPRYRKSWEKSYRGISKETFEKVGAYITDKDGFYGKRIIFPIRGLDSNPVTFEAISTSKKVLPKVLRPKGVDTTHTFGFEEQVTSDTLFICEGLFSALSLIEIGQDAVFNFGVGDIGEKVNKLHRMGVRNIILTGDHDEPGREFNRKSYHVLKRSFNLGFFQYPYFAPDKTDPNDLLKGNELGSHVKRTLRKVML